MALCLRIPQPTQRCHLPYPADLQNRPLRKGPSTSRRIFLIRTLSDFKAEKLIDIQDGKIHITDVQKLQNLLY
jgi:hypothetical protein